ncbi:hypothetical protein E2320_017999 [Naja naja]|nr:hypothetical protein E2320_017999 [Naja naja]
MDQEQQSPQRGGREHYEHYVPSWLRMKEAGTLPANPRQNRKPPTAAALSGLSLGPPASTAQQFHAQPADGVAVLASICTAGGHRLLNVREAYPLPPPRLSGDRATQMGQQGRFSLSPQRSSQACALVHPPPHCWADEETGSHTHPFPLSPTQQNLPLPGNGTEYMDAARELPTNTSLLCFQSARGRTTTPVAAALRGRGSEGPTTPAPDGGPGGAGSARQRRGEGGEQPASPHTGPQSPAGTSLQENHRLRQQAKARLGGAGLGKAAAADHLQLSNEARLGRQERPGSSQGLRRRTGQQAALPVRTRSNCRPGAESIHPSAGRPAGGPWARAATANSSSTGSFSCWRGRKACH